MLETLPLREIKSHALKQETDSIADLCITTRVERGNPRTIVYKGKGVKSLLFQRRALRQGRADTRSLKQPVALDCPKRG